MPLRRNNQLTAQEGEFVGHCSVNGLFGSTDGLIHRLPNLKPIEMGWKNLL